MLNCVVTGLLQRIYVQAKWVSMIYAKLEKVDTGERCVESDECK